MQLDLNNLPSDTVLLHRLVRDIASVVEHRDSEIERLQSIIKKLQRAQFGRRSERLDADQLALALEDLDGDIARIRESRPIVIAETDDGRPKRKPLPDHLPRGDVVLAIGSDICGCCGGALHAIRGSVSERRGWGAAHAGGWKHCMSDCAKTYLPPTICLRTTRRSRCSIRAVDERKQDGSGSMPATNGHGAVPRHRRRSICSRPTGRLSDRWRISRPSKASCTSMVTRDSSG